MSCPPTFNTFHDDDKEIFRIIKRLYDEFSNSSTGHTEMERCLIIEAIILTMRKISVGILPHSDISGFVCAKIRERYKENLKLSDLCCSLNYSLPYVSKIFKRDTCITFSQYLQKIRIEESCRLLVNTDKKIEEVAEGAGYLDVKFFQKVFKSFIHSTPREFRKNHTQ